MERAYQDWGHAPGRSDLSAIVRVERAYQDYGIPQASLREVVLPMQIQMVPVDDRTILERGQKRLLGPVSGPSAKRCERYR